MDIDANIKVNEKEWTEEVIEEGEQIQHPMLAISFDTIARYFQNIWTTYAR